MIKTSYESTASTIDEAIESGLKELNLTREAVEVEVIDEGSKGLFGLGSRDAIVRLTPKGVIKLDASPSEPISKVLEEPQLDADESEDSQDLAEFQVFETIEDNLLTISRETVAELIQKMHIDAEVTAKYQDQEDERRNRPRILVEVHGDDLSILIGRQANTLNALQYITRLIVSKEAGRGIDLQVDVQGYRARRAEQLHRLANQMAEQAVLTGKRQYLEPMPADDRRLIHIAIRNHPDVYTESIGEGSRRKVTINPK